MAVTNTWRNQPRCPNCGKFCGEIPVEVWGGTSWRESCLSCGLNPPACCFEDGSVRGCTNRVTHEVPDKKYYSRFCEYHAPDEAVPLPFVDVKSQDGDNTLLVEPGREGGQ